MAKFRTNHSRQTRGRSATVVRLGVIAFLFFAGLLGYLWVSGGGWTDLFASSFPPPRPPEHRFHLPKAKEGQYWVYYPYHSVLIDSVNSRALLATSLLDVRLLKGSNAGCGNQYLSDPNCSIKMPSSDSFHHLISPNLLPSSDTSGLCFYSNLTELSISQKNNWKKLQLITLEWLGNAGQIYLVTGNVRDSSAHFWVGLDLRSNPQLAIGAWLDHREGINWMSVDSLEVKTGIDFFSELMTDSLEMALETTWPVDQIFYLYDRN